jgi:predicted nucleic acid-binding protein
MTLYDSSVLIDYLDGHNDTVTYIRDHYDERAVAPPLVLYEVYQGEVYKSGPAKLDAVDAALEWLVVLDETRDHARTAAELQNDLAGNGNPLAARDAFIAGTANALGERLVVSDRDFDIPELTDILDVDII